MQHGGAATFSPQARPHSALPTMSSEISPKKAAAMREHGYTLGEGGNVRIKRPSPTISVTWTSDGATSVSEARSPWSHTGPRPSQGSPHHTGMACPVRVPSYPSDHVFPRGYVRVTGNRCLLFRLLFSGSGFGRSTPILPSGIHTNC